MTFKIDRETLPCSAEDFAAIVDAHAAALNEYAEHLKGVAADEVDLSLKLEERRVAFPPPEAHELIVRAIRQDGNTFIADYELIGPSLEVRKQRLSNAVNVLEQAEHDKILPPRKARYLQLLVGEANERLNKGIATDEDDRLLTEAAARRKKIDAVERWAAKAHHDIEDLTEETIDAWKLESFSG